MRTLPLLLITAALALPGCHRSSRVEIGNRLPEGTPAMNRTNLVYKVTRPDGSTYRGAFLRFAVGTPALSVNFSDPEGEVDEGVLVVSGTRPVVRSVRAVAISKGTVLVLASNASEDVIAVLEGGPAEIYARTPSGERGRRLATLETGQHIRINDDGASVPAPIPSRSDSTLDQQLRDWRSRAERLWAPSVLAPAPTPVPSPDPDEPAPPIPPKPPTKPGSARNP